MCDEIQALRSDNTWSLVPFHPLMNVVGSRWVYKMAVLSNIRHVWLLEALLSKKALIIMKP